jgi:hypothetical protein
MSHTSALPDMRAYRSLSLSLCPCLFLFQFTKTKDTPILQSSAMAAMRAYAYTPPPPPHPSTPLNSQDVASEYSDTFATRHKSCVFAEPTHEPPTKLNPQLPGVDIGEHRHIRNEAQVLRLHWRGIRLLGAPSSYLSGANKTTSLN